MRAILADIRRTQGPVDRFASACVGAGRAHELLRAETLSHLELVRNRCGFEYCRFHGLLHDDMGVCRLDDAGRPVHSFQYIDMVYDAMLDRGVRPFVELSFMPSALASGGKTVFWWKGNITPPKDYAQWKSLIEALVRHWLRRYGRDEVAKWYFEVWNEPNLKDFWSGSMEDYFRLYRETATTIKRVCPELRVGGPATAGFGWIEETLDFCIKNDVPLDFLSTHTYGVDGFLDEFGKSMLKLAPLDTALGPGAVRWVKDFVKASARPDLEIHFTEWNSSYSPLDPVHDSYYNAAFILRKLKEVQGQVDSFSYWTFSDIFEEAGVPPTPFHGGFGLVNIQGLRKPSFFAYEFLHALAGDQVECADADSFVCTHEGAVQALFWNITAPVQGNEPNQRFFVKEWPAKPLADTTLQLAGLAPGHYTLTATRIGYGSNDVQTDWIRMGSPAHLTREEVRSLDSRNSGAPLLTERVVVGADGRWERPFPMRENDVWRVELAPVG